MKEQNTIQYLINITIYLLKLFSIFFILMYLLFGAYRLFYQYELWWFEGDALNQVSRIVTGNKIYVPPSFEYIPMIYAPLYFYISAFFAKILGVHLYVLRLVSFGSTLGTLYLIFVFIRQETKKGIFGIIGAGFFASTYALSGAFLDTARVDSLFVFLLLVSIYFSKFGKRKTDHILASVLLVLSCLTKQSTIIILPFILMYYVVSRRTRLLDYFVTFALLYLGSIYLLNTIHDGWYSYFVYMLPGKHIFDLRYLVIFFGLDVMKIGIAFVFVIVYIWTLLGNKREDAVFYSLFIGGMIVMSCLSRLNIGGSSNTAIPMYTAVSIGFGLALASIHSMKKKQGFVLAVMIISIIQYLILTYNPLTLVPSRETEASTKRLVTFINKQQHGVFIPSNSYLQKLADKPVHADMHMLNELLGGFGDRHPTREGNAIISQIKQKINNRTFDAIILEKYDSSQFFLKVLNKDIETHYKKSNRSFVIWKGTQTVPVYIYSRK